MAPSKNLTNCSTTALCSYKTVWRAALIVALLQACYAAVFIAGSSFVVEGQRYFCLFDDAMISMRYAANWAAGNGLVWNVGERVEGYTNFLWTMIMGLCHLLRMSPSKTCLLVQILGIPILWSCLAGTVLLAKASRLSPISACCAVILAGTGYCLIFFTLFGMETGLLTALVTFALAEAVTSLDKNRGSIASMLWFAPAALVRIDVLPVMLFIFAVLLLWVKKGRIRLIIGLFIVACVVLMHFLWRYHYYGQWLPNTYYLKATGWPLKQRIMVGLNQTLWTAVTFGFPALLAVIVLLRPRRWHFLLLGCFALGVAYQIYVGGDAWPLNRFALPASLGLLVLASEGIGRIALFIKHKINISEKLVFAALTVLCVIAGNSGELRYFLFLEKPYTTDGNRKNVMYVHSIERIASPNASVAVGCAGTVAYFSPRRFFDLLGKCDPYIAHLPVHTNVHRAGHNKFDIAYSLTKYKPDIVLHTIVMNEPEFLQNYRPVTVQVDGEEMMFCIRRGVYKFRKGRTVEWPMLAEHIRLILEDSKCLKFLFSGKSSFYR